MRTKLPLLAFGLLLVCGCGRDPGAAGGRGADADGGLRGRLVIFEAASLTRPFAALERRFEALHPGLDVVRESSSSRVAIRKITELHREADILASADDKLIPELMMPEYADWMARFARNRIVIAYTDRSRYRSEINVDNWYDILLREDVNYGYSNPELAPVGYLTRQCWKLADLYYADRLQGRSLHDELVAGCPPENIRPHCNELLPLLESLSLDYIFEYRSVTLQHHLEWLKLPDEIDLGNETMADLYRRVSIDVPGKDRGSVITRIGEPVIYGLTIVRGAPNSRAAEAFLAFLFGPEGQAIMAQNYQEMIVPPLCDNVPAVPAALQPFFAPQPESNAP